MLSYFDVTEKSRVRFSHISVLKTIDKKPEDTWIYRERSKVIPASLKADLRVERLVKLEALSSKEYIVG